MLLKATSPAAYSRVALGQFVPHDDHRDATGQADENQSGHELGLAAKKQTASANMRIGPMIQF